MGEQTLFWPLLVYFIFVLILVTGMVGLSYFLGQRHQDRATGQPFESGIVSVGSARLRFSVSFYLIAMFFVIFDLETVFLVAWAVSIREAGWPGFIEAAIFIAVLLAALVYLSRVGALDWRTKRQKSMLEKTPKLES